MSIFFSFSFFAQTVFLQGAAFAVTSGGKVLSLQAILGRELDFSKDSLSYTYEFLMGYMGSPSRWRTMPWMVANFDILVIPLGLVHILLVISQPIVVGESYAFCLLVAAIMLLMLPLEVDEVIAMEQHMVQSRKRGDN